MRRAESQPPDLSAPCPRPSIPLYALVAELDDRLFVAQAVIGQSVQPELFHAVEEVFIRRCG